MRTLDYSRVESGHQLLMLIKDRQFEHNKCQLSLSSVGQFEKKRKKILFTLFN